MLKIIQKAFLLSAFGCSFVFPMGQIARVGRVALARTLNQSAPFRNSLPAKCSFVFPPVAQMMVEEATQVEVKAEIKESEAIDAAVNKVLGTNHQDVISDNMNHQGMTTNNQEIVYVKIGNEVYSVTVDPKTGERIFCCCLNSDKLELPNFNKNDAMDLLQRHTSLHPGSVALDHQLQSHSDMIDARALSNEKQASQYMSKIAFNAQVKAAVNAIVVEEKLELFSDVAKLSTMVQSRTFPLDKASEFMKDHALWSNSKLQGKQVTLANDLCQSETKFKSLMEKDAKIAFVVNEILSGKDFESIKHDFLNKISLQENRDVKEALKLDVAIKSIKADLQAIDCKFNQDVHNFANKLKHASLDTIEKIKSELMVKAKVNADALVPEKYKQNYLNNTLNDIEAKLEAFNNRSVFAKCVNSDYGKALSDAKQKFVAEQKNTSHTVHSLEVKGKELHVQIEQIDKIAVEKQHAKEAQLLQEKQEQEALISYEEQAKSQYESLDCSIQNCPDSVLHERQEALSQTERDGYASYDQEHYLSPQAAAFLQMHGIDYVQVHNFQGTAFQQQLHREYCDIVEQAAAKQAQLPYQSDLLKQCVLCADAAYDANQLGQIKTVLSLNNLGFALLEYGQAIGSGLLHSGQDFVHTIMHPVQTIEAVGKAVYYVLETAALNCYSEEYGFEDLYIPLRDQRNAEIVEGLKSLGNAIANSTGPQRVEALTRFAADFFVPGKIVKVVGGVLGVAESAAVKGASIGEQVGADIAKTAQKVEVLAQETIAQKTAQKLLDVEKQFDKSAKSIAGHGVEPVRTDKYGIIQERSFVEKKMSALEHAQKEAIKIKELSDGRMRYYDLEVPAKTPGLTRGRSHVTEFDPKTGRVRLWEECYDHAGNVNRVRPEMINGRDVVSQHYPATYKDIQDNIQRSKWFIPKR